MSIEILMALVALVATGIGTAAGLVWKLTRVEQALRADIQAARKEVDERQDRHAREVGEGLSALRQKVNDVELEGHKTFIRREGFYKAQEFLTEQVKALRETMEARFQRLEDRLDARDPRG